MFFGPGKNGKDSDGAGVATPKVGTRHSTLHVWKVCLHEILKGSMYVIFHEVDCWGDVK